ncbi:DUF305 domain-containing protein [Cronbergia sp. UHCC 0137]|uniref:DUF305 domain-containing protein n=1 Tax=Cronbergia sp. UHCC 0137 TaxID=3110239 RepID=UPI002B2201C4|nr:DUF305 domain-containing protein [Cronbergia sp. UHCC 0137]MEA5621023.1 DUF305 domain-containing protein [Cronbergia sp. UHCC 0137]
MQLKNLKNRFLTTFTLMASLTTGIAFSSSIILAGCSRDASPNQVQNTTVDQTMNHSSSMNHSMTMDLGPGDANYDLRFIDGMIPHHQGAVIMAKEAQQKSKRPEMKKLADEIIKAQNLEIAQMQQWRKTWYPKAGNKPMAYDAKMGHEMEMSSDQMQGMMMNMDLGAADTKFDLRFIAAMIPHHQAAVTMATDALQKSQRPEIKKLAQAIINSQKTEIEQMKQWQKAWYK